MESLANSSCSISVKYVTGIEGLLTTHAWVQDKFWEATLAVCYSVEVDLMIAIAPPHKYSSTSLFL